MPEIKDKEVIEYLMNPRYKVIADYPGSEFVVGEVLNLILIEFSNEFWTGDGDRYMTESTIKLYPHLFKPLEWWEGRKPEEMPQYVKLISIPESGSYFLIGDIMKVQEWALHSEATYSIMKKHLSRCLVIVAPNHRYNAARVLPSTETEYLNYINSKK